MAFEVCVRVIWNRTVDLCGCVFRSLRGLARDRSLITQTFIHALVQARYTSLNEKRIKRQAWSFRLIYPPSASLFPSLNLFSLVLSCVWPRDDHTGLLSIHAPLLLAWNFTSPTHLSDFFSLSFIIAPVLVICVSAILASIMGAAEEWGYKPAFWYVHEYAIVSVLMSAAGGMGL